MYECPDRIHEVTSVTGPYVDGFSAYAGSVVHLSAHGGYRVRWHVRRPGLAAGAKPEITERSFDRSDVALAYFDAAIALCRTEYESPAFEVYEPSAAEHLPAEEVAR